MTERLPTDGGDSGTWGAVLNGYLGVSMAADGTLKDVLSGTGTPEGAVTGTVGQLFRRTNGSTGTTLYIKETGSGNTGWRAVAATGSVAADAIFDAKGDLPVGTGADTAAKLTVGANDTVLVADSAQTTGAKWVQIGNAQVLSNAAIAISKLADPTTGKVIGSTASAAAAVYPPGYEFGYDQIVTPAAVSSTTEASGSTVITCAAHTFDGAAVMVDFYTCAVYTGDTAGRTMTISLFESSTQITRLAQVIPASGAADIGVPTRAGYRFTPSAASHTYTVTAIISGASANAQIAAVAGGTGGNPPCYIRFTKV